MKFKTAIYTLFAFSPFTVVGLFVASTTSPEVRHALDEMPLAGGLAIGGFLLAALLAYVWDVWHSPRMPTSKRALWTAVLFLGNWYALPFYWWFYIRGSGVQQNE